MPGLFDLTVGQQILVIIVGGLGLFVLRQLFVWSIQALASAIVTAINGQLGLDAIRDDVSSMKRQVEHVPVMRTRIENMEERIETILEGEV